MFVKVLVANRGEIAVRIFRTLRELGLGSVAVYSDADRAALHVALRRRGVRARRRDVGRELSRRRQAARGGGALGRRGGSSRATASSPRTPAFARAVEEAGLVWIGPPPAAIELMGSKTRARQAMQAAGVPIIPGTTEPVGSAEEVVALGEQIGYPLLDQGGRGRRRQGHEGRLLGRTRPSAAFESAQREGQVVLRRRVGLRRALPRGPAARRGAGSRRRARQRHPPRRARLHDPAPPPEARRGDAVARCRRRSCATGSARSPSTRRAPPATAPPGRSRACSRRTATTTSWR